MLSKCLKHEFRATYRTIVPILLGVVLFSGVAYLTNHVLYTGEAPLVIEVIAIFVRLFYTLAIGAASIGVTIVCVLRYWRSFHSDEGYLTMTMPVSTHTQIFSKLIVAECWILLTLIVVFAASILSEVEIWKELFYVAEDAEIMYDPIVMDANLTRQSFLFLGLILIYLVIGTATSTLMLYAAISLGHSFQKYKKLLSVVFVFVFNQAIGMLSFVPMVVLLASGWMEDFIIDGDLTGIVTGINIMLGILLVLFVVFGVVFYFTTHYFLSKKLNLQ